MTTCSFTIINNKKLEDWVNNITQELSKENLNLLFTTALNIGRIALKQANYYEGEDSLKDAISDTIIDTINSNINPQVAQVSSLIAEFRKIGFGNEGSSKKGKSNEILIHKKLCKEITNWEFTKVSADAMNCDLLAEQDNKKVMIELKEYSSPVPTKEIKKFIRDVSAKSPNGGLFISTGSITGQVNDYTIDYRMINGTTIPLLFVANCSPSSWVLAFLLLEELMQNKICDKLQNKETDISYVNLMIKTFIENMQDSITRLHILDTEISRMRAEYAETRKKINDLLDETYKSILSLEIGVKMELQLIIAKFSQNEFLQNCYNDSGCITIFGKETFASWAVENQKKEAYSFLYFAAKAAKCKLGINNKTNELVVVAKNSLVIAYAIEKPNSIQLIYNQIAADGMEIYYGYEVANQAGQLYFNLCKIKNSHGEELLTARLRGLAEE